MDGVRALARSLRGALLQRRRAKTQSVGADVAIGAGASWQHSCDALDIATHALIRGESQPFLLSLEKPSQGSRNPHPSNAAVSTVITGSMFFRVSVSRWQAMTWSGPNLRSGGRTVSQTPLIM